MPTDKDGRIRIDDFLFKDVHSEDAFKVSNYDKSIFETNLHYAYEIEHYNFTRFSKNGNFTVICKYFVKTIYTVAQCVEKY